MRLILSDLILTIGFVAVSASILTTGRVIERRVRSYEAMILAELQNIRRENCREDAAKPQRESEERTDPEMMEGFNNLMRYTASTGEDGGGK